MTATLTVCRYGENCRPETSCLVAQRLPTGLLSVLPEREPQVQVSEFRALEEDPTTGQRRGWLEALSVAVLGVVVIWA
jgi:hypothetical protein